MYKRYQISSCKTSLDNEEKLIYKYYLTESLKEININSHYVSVPSFGIEAACERIIGDCVVRNYTEAIECMSPQKAKVLELIEFLCSHQVSPVHLIDIAGPFADEWVEDYNKEADSFMGSVMLS